MSIKDYEKLLEYLMKYRKVYGIIITVNGGNNG